MGLKLLESVEEILDRVKRETGKEILLFENDKMSSMVEVKSAREADENHLMAYSSNYTPEINHLVASKALQIIRMFKETPENRKIAVAYQDHLNNARMGIALEVERKPHLEVVLNDHNLTSTWVLSLINQLISQPANLNVEKEIYNNYPDLRQFQKSIINSQFTDFNLTLSKEVESLSPSIIYNTSAIMNYVYLKIIDDITGSDFIDNLNYIVKRSKSETLYEYSKKNLENSITGDIKMTDYWAKYLNIENWYTWIDFEDGASN
ncbi:hypothetical protein EW093_09985 [Thiospirochaeta perfilievii]|uniref:Uncharacterized protein n=1 Tax=Thiospirochaeta perfilievii TaxID=252967 RepID=A0A5C1QAE1_9SPIO|nr:hypothetical protein [Thiospirochaeta perfilievii]QEN05025.1 hypothetical protein EW093_09985 [Thiospirochaeta perfilievii]